MQVKDYNLEKLLELVKKYDLSELNIRDGRFSLELKRNANQLRYATQALPGIDSVTLPIPPFGDPIVRDQPAPEATSAAEVKETDPPANIHEVKAPLVGTFYRAPSPDADPFAEEGDHIRVNDKLCIIEAMKIMNEIECPVDGIVKEICAVNGNPVEFGQVLFRIEVTGGGS